MATVDGYTKARTKAIEDGAVVSGAVNVGTGHLILTTHDGHTIDAGNVVGPTGPMPTADPLANPNTVVGRDTFGQSAFLVTKSGGLTGTLPNRWVGSTATGPPASGTWQASDFIVAADGVIWTCIVAGTPGVWIPTGDKRIFNYHRAKPVDFVPTTLIQHYSSNSVDPWDYVHYYRDENNIVHIGGLATVIGGAIPISTVLFVLPVGFRPALNLRFPVSHGAGTYWIQVMSNGNVQIDANYGGIAAGASFLGFEHVHFPAEDYFAPNWIDLTPYLAAGWGAYGGGHSTPRCYIDASGDAYFQGNIKRTSGANTYTGNIFATLPAALQAPTAYGSQILLGGASLTGWYARLDYVPGASALLALSYYCNGSGLSGGDHISLDNVILPGIQTPAKFIQLGHNNSWADYGSGFGLAKVYRNSIGRCFATGLIVGGGAGLLGLGQLGGSGLIKPRSRKLFTTIAAGTGTTIGSARTDLNPDYNGSTTAGVTAGVYPGASYYNTGTNGYLSINGVQWDPITR